MKGVYLLIALLGKLWDVCFAATRETTQGNRSQGSRRGGASGAEGGWP